MSETKSRTILLSIVYVITAIAVLLGAYAIYYIAAVEKPWTIGTSYMSTLTYSENHESIMTINIYSNENGNGQDLYELQFNSYTDANGNGVAGFGMQCLGNWNVATLGNYSYGYSSTSDYYHKYLFNPEAVANYSFKTNNLTTAVKGNFSYYSTTDRGLSYYYLDEKYFKDYLLIDINGEFYKLTLKKYNYENRSEKSFWGQVKGWFNGSGSYDYFSTESQFTWFDVFNKIMQSAKINSAKEEYRTFALNCFDLADYLTIEYKDERGQYHRMEETSDTQIKLSIPVIYHKDGITEASDSLFKMVKYSTTWNYWDNTSVKDYWDVATPITINESQLNYIYYEAYDAYFLTLDKKLSNYLKTSNAEINVILDLNNKTQYELSGIDLVNFGFKINNFSITNAPEDFLILNQESCSTVPTMGV